MKVINVTIVFDDTGGGFVSATSHPPTGPHAKMGDALAVLAQTMINAGSNGQPNPLTKPQRTCHKCQCKGCRKRRNKTIFQRLGRDDEEPKRGRAAAWLMAAGNARRCFDDPQFQIRGLIPHLRDNHKRALERAVENRCAEVLP